MATKKRVYAEVEDKEAAKAEPSDEGVDESDLPVVAELRAVNRRVEELKKEYTDLREKIEALNHALYDYDPEGKKYSVMKKALGMSNFHHAWIKHAEEVMPSLKMPERDTTNGWKK